MPVGVGLDIPAPVASKISSATMEVCWAGNCVARQVELHPSSGPGETGCAGGSPTSVCSAQMTATGGKNGFADIPGLPATPVRVTVTFDDGRAHPVDVTPKFSSSGGPGCASLGPQAQLVVGADGEVLAR
jgi:hypothetical protein